METTSNFDEIVAMQLRAYEQLGYEEGERYLKFIAEKTAECMKYILENNIKYDDILEDDNDTKNVTSDDILANDDDIKNVTSNQKKITRHNLLTSLPVAFTPKRKKMLEDSGFVCSIYSKALKKYLIFDREVGAWFYFKDENNVLSKFYKKDIRKNKMIELDII